MAWRAVELSPDGRYVAVWRVNGNEATRPAWSTATVLLIPTDGGEPRELLRSAPTDEVFRVHLAWGPGGRSLLAQKNTAGGAQLWSVPIDGGERRKLDLSFSNAVGMRVHPDGRQVAYVDGENKNEVMVLENFLPANTTVK